LRFKKLCLILLAIGLLGMTVVWAAEQNWVDRTMISGMSLFVQKTNSPVIDVALLLKTGSGIEKDKKGSAMIMNNLVMLKLKYGEAKLSEVDVNTYPDYTLIEIRTTNQALKKVLKEIRDLLSYPLYSYDIITDLKGIYQTDLEGVSALANSYYDFNQEFYGKDHPYNNNLTPESIKALSGTDVYRWYRQTYQPGNAILSIAGDVNLSIGELEKVFKEMISEKANWRLDVDPIKLTKDRVLEVEDRNGREASVAIGMSAPRIQDPEYPAFRVLSYYLGEYMHYFEELRVKEGLFYSNYVFYDYLGRFQAPNIILLTTTDPESLKRVETRTLEVIDQIVKQGINQQEIDEVVQAIKTKDKADLEAGKGIAVTNALGYYINNPLVLDRNLWSKLEKVTTQDVKKAASKYLQNYLRVTYLPKEMPDNF